MKKSDQRGHRGEGSNSGHLSLTDRKYKTRLEFLCENYILIASRLENTKVEINYLF